MNNISLTGIDEDFVTIRQNEYEELVRDSEKLRIIETLARNPDSTLYRDTILAICGYTLEVTDAEMS